MTTEREKARRKAERARYKLLTDIGEQWNALNPNHCPECYCRPGKGDAQDGSDHEVYCSQKGAS